MVFKAKKLVRFWRGKIGLIFFCISQKWTADIDRFGCLGFPATAS